MKRAKLEIIYSIGVLIAVPIIVIANTIILTQSTNNAFNAELRRKADLVNSVIAESSLPLIQDERYDQLQTNLNDLESSQPALMQSAIVTEKDGQLSVIAHSSSAPDALSQTADTAIKLAIGRKIPIAALTDTTDRRHNPTQAWNVITPVIDSDNNAIAAVSTSLLITDAQEAIDSAYRTSFFVLVISILLIIALLFRHFRLVGYAQLLNKQRELNQTMSDFLSVATHELKAPTTVIRGYLSNITDGDYGEIDPKIKEPIEIAISQTERLNSLVQDLLNVSRIEQGRIQYNFTSVDTQQVLNVITENYRTIAKSKGLELVYQPSDSLPAVHADEGRVQEIFTNLIDNAIKYTAKGSVTITQQIIKNNLVTSIRDTGFGISPEARQRLFQRFYRVQTAQTQNISGTGLGLWIIKQYVTSMGGTIDVETMENVGSNFIVSLPIDKATKKS